MAKMAIARLWLRPFREVLSAVDAFLESKQALATRWAGRHTAGVMKQQQPSCRTLSYIRSACLAALLLSLPAGLRAQNPWERLPPTPNLPKPARSGTAPVDGIRLWYAVYGHGAPVILLHGGLANSNYWGLQIPALAAHFEVIAVDSRGHGRSTWDGGPISYHLMASDVLALMDALHISKTAVVGWSDGGILGLDIAIHYPQRLSKLFAFGANSSLAGVRSSEGSATFAAYVSRTRTEYRQLSPTPEQFNAFHEQLSKMWDSEPDFSDAQLRSITVPTWIVDGDRDEIIKRDDTDHMAGVIPGAGELILPRASHFAFLQDPKQFNDALLHFLLTE
jgi:pimeloyl-ACP methyl ester carboxylesterase